MYQKIKELADAAIALQNKDKMDSALREISAMCEPEKEYKHVAYGVDFYRSGRVGVMHDYVAGSDIDAGNLVMISEDETTHLLGSSANAEHLEKSISQLRDSAITKSEIVASVVDRQNFENTLMREAIDVESETKQEDAE